MLKGIPLDSPLYEVDEDRGIEYRNCDAIVGFFTIKGDVSELLPERLKPYSQPAQGESGFPATLSVQLAFTTSISL